MNKRGKQCEETDRGRADSRSVDCCATASGDRRSELAGARFQGRHVAEIAARVKHGAGEHGPAPKEVPARFKAQMGCYAARAVRPVQRLSRQSARSCLKISTMKS